MRHTIISCFGNCFCCILLNIWNCRVFCKWQELLNTPCLLNQHHCVPIFKTIGYHCKCFYMKVIQFLIIKANTTSESWPKRNLEILLPKFYYKMDQGHWEHNEINFVVTEAKETVLFINTWFSLTICPIFSHFLYSKIFYR